ncbi:MAG: hypothetical protein M1829_000853 [Trizodia sp. TS-e1964]|nr:MAG: hypothetical protein M1829_000853 [Trizodia sp. TS-e1964]
MGRQAYITRLALGRSAYEPPERPAETSTPEAPSSPPSTNTLGTFGNQFHNYVQKYDSRGRPVNPASRAMSRILIRAQNDVLATVGVCVGIQVVALAEGDPTEPRPETASDANTDANATVNTTANTGANTDANTNVNADANPGVNAETNAESPNIEVNTNATFLTRTGPVDSSQASSPLSAVSSISTP